MMEVMFLSLSLFLNIKAFHCGFLNYAWPPDSVAVLLPGSTCSALLNILYYHGPV